jgi:hypothetical protein
MSSCAGHGFPAIGVFDTAFEARSEEVAHLW